MPGEWLSQLEVWGRPAGCCQSGDSGRPAARTDIGADSATEEADPVHHDWHAW